MAEDLHQTGISDMDRFPPPVTVSTEQTVPAVSSFKARSPFPTA